jgi:Domain of unknown function (DUF4194)
MSSENMASKDPAPQLELAVEIPAFLLKRAEPQDASPPQTDGDGPAAPEGSEAQVDFVDRDLVLDSEQPVGEAQSQGAAKPADRHLFPGDCGELRAETRRALVSLLAGPSVDGERQPKLWMVLKRDEAVLRSRLSDLFLELTVDDESRVAFVRQVPQYGDTDIPVLLRRQPLTFLQSAGLLLLRAALATASAQGQRAVIGGAEFIADLGAYEDASKSDKARFTKQCIAVLEALKRVNVLRPIPGSADRFEVSPTLALLLPAEQLEAFARTYETLRQTRVPSKKEPG